MSTTQYLTDAATRHQVFLQRYAGHQSKEATKLLYRMRRKINARLAQEPTDFQRARLEAVLHDINEITKIGFKDIQDYELSEARRLIKSEARTSVNLFSKATTTDFVYPSDTALITAVMTSGLTVATGTTAGVTIQQALEQFGTKKAKQIAQTISDGVLLGETTPEISKKVGGLINTLQRRQLDTLTRTIVNSASSMARSQVYSTNSDILDGYRWIATLDNKTTIICGSRDQKVFQEGGPVPPAHWNCRSTTIPVVKPEYDMGAKIKGKRPAIEADGVKQVSGKTTYGGWLKRQPVEFVDEALGVERSRLFRSGKLTLDKFVDPTGRVYTLEQLEKMNPIAFIEN